VSFLRIGNGKSGRAIWIRVLRHCYTSAFGGNFRDEAQRGFELAAKAKCYKNVKINLLCLKQGAPKAG